MGNAAGSEDGPQASRAGRLARWDAAPRPVVTPSLLACDFARMADELAALEAAGFLGVQLDVMDGHFVPNLTYGPSLAAAWRTATGMFFDTHLMMSDPAPYLDAFINAGCDQIIVHIEAVPEPRDLLRRIRDGGCRASLAFNPPTPAEAVLPHLDAIDSLLVMSVPPGFGGQAFQASVLEKVRAIRRQHPSLAIGIDGGIDTATAAAATEAGVTQLVAGSSVFRGGKTYAEALAELTEAGRTGMRHRGGGAPGPAPS